MIKFTGYAYHFQNYLRPLLWNSKLVFVAIFHYKWFGILIIFKKDVTRRSCLDEIKNAANAASLDEKYYRRLLLNKIYFNGLFLPENEAASAAIRSSVKWNLPRSSGPPFFQGCRQSTGCWRRSPSPLRIVQWTAGRLRRRKGRPCSSAISARSS